MQENQSLRGRPARLVNGLLIASAALLLGACGTFRGQQVDSDAGLGTMSTDTGERDTTPPITATEAAVAASPEGAPADEAAPAVDRSVVNPTAPLSYTVKRGDTLWDLANMFLRDPWLWPEIWQINPQVQNPHLIYPGDVLSLVYGADGRPQIRLTQGGAARLNPLLRSSELDGAIATIPYSAIAAFLERPTVVSADQAKNAPRVLAFREGHMIGGSGIDAYVRNLKSAQPLSRYAVVHIGDAIRDPESGDLLGYTGIYTATAIVERPGEPTKVTLTDSARETLEGDRLLSAETEVPLNFVPRAPSRPVSGQIVSVVDGVELIGQYRIVVINRGRRHGLEPGNVLAVDQRGPVVQDASGRRFSTLGLGSAFAPNVRLPDERAGTMLVFRVFDRMSYALIVSASAPLRVADVVRNP